MRNRKTKKGFTIIELVIVIAVIGILAAILIPTFINLNAKANRASDQSLMANLNTALKMQEAEPGDAKNNTLHDAVEDLKNQGYLLNQITTKSDEKLIWNSETNQFEFEADQVGPKFWKIFDAAPASSNTYSVYVRTAWGSSITVDGVGFDVGYTTDFATINYINTGTTKNVAIRTNDCSLTVNAGNVDDTVRHYGEGTVLTIEAIGNSSYHEYGYFPEASIKQGRFVVENQGKIQVVDATAATAAVVVEKAGSGIISNIVKGENTNVTVASDLVDKIATKTTVSTLSELTAALAGDFDVIQFGANIATAETINITRSVSILGEGNKLSASTVFGAGLLTLSGNGNSIFIDNLDMKNVNANNGWGSAYSRCIEIDCDDNTKNLKIDLNNMKMFAKYAFYTKYNSMEDGHSVGGNHSVTLNKVEFNPSCYIALYWRLSNSNVVANNCSFASLNTSDGATNSTATVCVGNVNITVTSEMHGQPENNVFAFNNCVIETTQTGTASQNPIGIYSPYNNIVNVNNCVLTGARANIVAQKWNAEAVANPSHLYIDGVLADNSFNVLLASGMQVNLWDVKVYAGTTKYNPNTIVDGVLSGYVAHSNGDGTYTLQPAN